MAGLEPARLTPTDFKSAVYTNSTTLARLKGSSRPARFKAEGPDNQARFITHRYRQVNRTCRFRGLMRGRSDAACRQRISGPGYGHPLPGIVSVYTMAKVPGVSGKPAAGNFQFGGGVLESSCRRCMRKLTSIFVPGFAKAGAYRPRAIVLSFSLASPCSGPTRCNSLLAEREP